MPPTTTYIPPTTPTPTPTVATVTASLSSSNLVPAVLDDGSSIIDNSDKNFISTIGAWTDSTYPYGGGPYKGYYDHDGNTAKGTKSYTFNFSLATTGDYQVYLYWSQSDNRATNVPVDITSSTGVNTVVVNEQTNGGKFNLLGSFHFVAVKHGAVMLRTTNTNGFVVADAIKLLKDNASVTIQPTALPAETPSVPSSTPSPSASTASTKPAENNTSPSVSTTTPAGGTSPAPTNPPSTALQPAVSTPPATTVPALPIVSISDTSGTETNSSLALLNSILPFPSRQKKKSMSVGPPLMGLLWRGRTIKPRLVMLVSHRRDSPYRASLYNSR